MSFEACMSLAAGLGSKEPALVLIRGKCNEVFTDSVIGNDLG